MRSAALLLCLLAAGCLDKPGELVITVDSPLAVPCNVDALSIEVVVDGASERRDLDLTAVTLPGSLSVLADDAAGASDAEIELVATRAGTPVAIGRATVPFDPGETQQVAFTLDGSCTEEAPCAPVISPRFGGLPPPVARRACVSAYEVRPTLASIVNACDLPGMIGSALVSANETEEASPLDPQLPYEFFFYNDRVDSIWIGDNGYIAFGADPPAATVGDVGVPRSLGEQGFPGPGVAAFWDQLVTGPRGVCVAVTGTSPNRITWTSWDQVCFEGVANETCGDLDFGSLTFSVGLEEGTDRIFVGYPEMVATGPSQARARGLTAVIGIAADEAEGRGCPASECSAAGLCDSGDPCNYTEFSALTDIGSTPPALEFVPQ